MTRVAINDDFIEQTLIELQYRLVFLMDNSSDQTLLAQCRVCHFVETEFLFSEGLLALHSLGQVAELVGHLCLSFLGVFGAAGRNHGRAHQPIKFGQRLTRFLW